MSLIPFKHTPKAPLFSTFLTLMLTLLSCGDRLRGEVEGVARYTYEVVRRYPHDPRAFTQGLAFDDEGRLLMSQGRYGESALTLRTLESASPLTRSELPSRLFGEGVAYLGDRLILMLTWRSGEALLYRFDQQEGAQTDELTLLKTLRYRGEGWGLAHSPEHGLIYSDGSSSLRWLSRAQLLSAEEGEALIIEREVVVREGGQPLGNLNELEWVGGLLFANLWRQDRAVLIEPSTGEVVASLELKGLLPVDDRPEGFNAWSDVLNGAAWRARGALHTTASPERKDLEHLSAEGGQLLLTGKRWPSLFEVRLKRLTSRP